MVFQKLHVYASQWGLVFFIVAGQWFLSNLIAVIVAGQWFLSNRIPVIVAGQWFLSSLIAGGNHFRFYHILLMFILYYYFAKPQPIFPPIISKPIDPRKGSNLMGRGPKGEKGAKGSAGFPGIPGRDGQNGQQGPRGARGFRGESIRGPPGPPGPSGILGNGGDNILTGPPGPPGPAGPPGRGLENVNSFTSGAVVLKNMDEMLGIGHIMPVGTIAYLLNGQALYVRVEDGWQGVQLGPLIQLPSTTSTVKPTPPIILPPEGVELVDGPMIHLVAANQPLSGDMSGIGGADTICHRQARDAGMKGTFRAFLTARVQDLGSVVLDKDVPVVNTKQQKLFTSWNEMFNGAGAHFNNKIPILSFDGRDIMHDPTWPQKIVWHGSDMTGSRRRNAYCDGWDSENPQMEGMASNLQNYMLLDQQKYSCGNAFIVLCVENTHRSDLRK